MRARALAFLLLAGAGALAEVEDDFGALRSLKDEADVALERAGGPSAGDRGRAAAYQDLRASVASRLGAVATPKDADDRRAVEVMRRALDADLPPRLLEANGKCRRDAL